MTLFVSDKYNNDYLYDDNQPVWVDIRSISTSLLPSYTQNVLLLLFSLFSLNRYLAVIYSSKYVTFGY